jgi:hypothetical protein
MWETVLMANTGQQALPDVNVNNYAHNYTFHQ